MKNLVQHYHNLVLYLINKLLRVLILELSHNSILYMLDKVELRYQIFQEQQQKYHHQHYRYYLDLLRSDHFRELQYLV